TAAPKKVDVKLSSKPAGARVSVDGAELGATPTTLAALDTSKIYAVAISSACFKTETVALAPKEDSRDLQVTLKPLERVVHVKSGPPGAFLSVDGRPAGKTPADVRLVGKLDAKTPHVFLLHKAGFESATTTVSPDSPCATEGDVGALGLSVSLTPLKRAEPAPAPVPAAARTPAPKPPQPAEPPKPEPAALPSKPVDTPP